MEEYRSTDSIIMIFFMSLYCIDNYLKIVYLYFGLVFCNGNWFKRFSIKKVIYKKSKVYLISTHSGELFKNIGSFFHKFIFVNGDNANLFANNTAGKVSKFSSIGGRKAGG